MPRLLCVWLQDGRNLVASCEESTAAKVKSAFYDRAASLTFTGDDSVEILPTSQVEGFAIVDRPVAMSASTAVYHYVAV